MDFSLYRTIARQGGVFTTAQALESVSAWEVRRLVASGRWRQLPWRGVYADGELPASTELQVKAAALLLGGDLVACRSTAALLHDCDVVEDPVLHFLGPPSVRFRALPGIRVHPSHRGVDDAVLVRDVWCTPLARTACDVVRTAAPVHGLAQLDAALHTRRCTPRQLRAEAEQHAGLRGARLLSRLVPWADRRAGSYMESRMRWRCLEGGLPAPDLQVRVGTDVFWREMDMAWRQQRVGAEFDGLVAHMTADQLRSDRERHNWLTERGWTLLHFTATDVYTRHEAMVATVARALRRSESGAAGTTRRG